VTNDQRLGAIQGLKWIYDATAAAGGQDGDAQAGQDQCGRADQGENFHVIAFDGGKQKL
jgi:hypothetical protein